jgi:ribose-phosphate pyrophosphokinase
MKIVPGPASKHSGEEIAKLLHVETVPLTSKTFPDGESYIRLDGNVQDEHVVVVQTTSPPQEKRLIELALIADAAKRNQATKVTAVVPYLAYARQDRIFLPGETISIQTVTGMLKSAGVDELLTVNVHQERILSKLPLLAKSVSASALLAQYFKQKGHGGAFALAPDENAMHIVEEAGKILGGGYGYLEKHRDRYTGQVSTEKRKLEVEGRTAIIFDDIISSGGTIIQAAKILRDLGARTLFAACAHALLAADAEKKILDSGVQEIVGTDSVESPVSKVPLAPLIADALVH